MKNIHRFISTFVLLTSPVACITFFGLSSCAKKDEHLDYQSQYADFINERTFSMYCKIPGTTYISIGTGWLFKRVANAQYSYYLATNTHVASNYSRTSDISMYLSYNQNYTNPNCYLSQNQYYLIQPSSYTLLGDVIDQQKDTRPYFPDWNLGSYIACMDFDVFKIDFGSEQNIKANDPFKINNTSPLLDRLNFLNDYADNHEQNLVEFAESDYVYKKNMSVHVGGFPVQPYPTNKNLTYPQWISYQTSLTEYYFGHTPQHPIISPSPKNDIRFRDDIPIAILGKAVGYESETTTKFTGGSSGSMIIDDNNVVIGINFAGNSDDNNQYYSYDNYGLLLNTRNSFFGKENNYEVFTDWFTNLT